LPVAIGVALGGGQQQVDPVPRVTWGWGPSCLSL
jgi:hypothetical protein